MLGVVTGATERGLPPPSPGGGGWITAENDNEYFNEKMVIGLVEKRKQEAELLKEGAGRVRGETTAMELNRRRFRMASRQPSGRRRLPLDCILLNPSMASLLSFATAAEFCKI